MSPICWIIEHPWISAGIAAVVLSTILDRWIVYYGKEYPAIARALRYVIDLLSFLPSRGHSLKRGLKLPLLAHSGRPAAASEPAEHKPGSSDEG